MCEIREIGSIFPINGTIGSDQLLGPGPALDGFQLLSLCREALYSIASAREMPGEVLIPSYTCQTVIDGFTQAGWEAGFYPIKLDLRIETEALLDMLHVSTPTAVLAHPYYGAGFSREELDALRECKAAGATVIGDLTQSLLYRPEAGHFDFLVGSIRKWGPFPDGAFLMGGRTEACNGYPENSDFASRQLCAMRLRAQYFLTGNVKIKDESRSINKDAERLACGAISPHSVSRISAAAIRCADWESISDSRLANYRLLHKLLRGRIHVRPVRECVPDGLTAPLYYPVYADARDTLSAHLAAHGVYAPTLWRVEDKRVLVNDDAAWIYGHVLAIPCDQRYGARDMELIAELIRAFDEM